MKTPKQKINLITLILVMLLANISFAQQNNIYGNLGAKPSPNYEDNGPILWNQMDVPGPGFITCQEFTDPANETMTSIAADDFFVPEGETWDIGTIAFVGTFFDYGVGPVDTFNIIFYDDAPGLPGAEVAEFYDVVGFTFETEIVNDYTVVTYHLKLPSQVSFEEGHYWMSVQAKGSFDVMGKWGWNDYWAGSQPPLDQQWHWKNPLDGFGLGYTDWTPAVTVAAIFTYYDLCFALYEPAFENDLAVYEIISPVGDEGLTTEEIVTIQIRNEGTIPQTGFNLKYIFNGVEVTENIGSVTVNPNEFYEFSFTQTVDMEVAGPYELSVATMLTGDEYPDNDMLNTTVYSYGTLYIMDNENTAATVTTCSGTSVDMGGLDANFEQTDYGTVTFYPASVGSLIRLTFLEFDIQWGEMELYDGPTIGSPSFGIFDKGTGSPGVITAFNAEGAITMRFEASGWDNGPGWVAFISCFDPVEDDFALLDLSLSSNSISAGEFITAFATVQNYGTIVQAKDVTFTANGEEFGVVNTGELEPFETTTVEAIWNPMEAGIYNLIAGVPDDDGIDNNNSVSMEQEVISASFLYEGFENETFPPEGWSLTTGFWERKTNSPMFGIATASAFLTPATPDTLITPLLQIDEGDEISYYLRGSWWWQSDLEVVYKESSSDTWVSLAYYSGFSIPVSATQYTLDLSDYADETGFIGFIAHGNVAWWDIGEVFLDEINGPKKLSYVSNLAATSFIGMASPNANETAVYECVVKNMGTESVEGDSYTVKLMDDLGTELTSLEGITILPLQELAFELEYTFTEVGTFPIHAYIDFPEDENPDDNASTLLTVYVQQEGTQQVQIGEGILETWQYPLGSGGAYQIAEMLYKNDEIGLTGIMNGISFFYRNNGVFPIEDYPVDIYVGETIEDELPFGTYNWINSTELNLVFSGSVTMYPGDNMMYIPYDDPYNYGGDNLVIMTYKTSVDYYGDVYWYCHATSEMQTKQASEYNFVPDPEDLSNIWANDKYIRPNARIYVLPAQGGYCTPQTIDGTDNGYYIDGVTLNTIANTGTGSQGGDDYNDYTALSTNLQRTKYYEMTFDVNTDGTGGSVAAWIDFNSDSDFDDEGEKICQVSGEGSSFTVSVPVVVPNTAPFGIKLMRVRAGDFTNGINACETITEGEAEDYFVNITETIQVHNPVLDFAATLDGADAELTWAVPVNPGQAYLEGFESSTWPVNEWEVKHSSSLTDALMDPVEASWEQTNEGDYVYNGDAAAYISADAPDFNWLITPQFQVYGDDAISFGIHYTSDASGYTKFYAMVEVDGSWTTALEYTDELTWANQYDEKVIVDLADFAGKMIRVAFVTENNSAYPVAIDDAIISSVVNLTDGFDGITGYEVYREGVMIGEITDPSVVSYMDVLSETENYTYCVVAVYGMEESEAECTDVFYLAPLTAPINLSGTVEGYDVHLQWTAPNAGIMRFNDDFEAYNAGEQVAEQNSENWSTWGNNPGGDEDPYVTTDMAYSGDNSVVIESLADLLWLHDEVLTEGRYSYNFKLYVPEGYNAYFNVLQEYTLGVGASWGFQAFFDQNGNGYIDANGLNSTSFTYGYDEWMYVELDINLDTDWAEFMINGESIYEWPWSAGIFGGGDMNQLQASDFYAWNVNGTPKYYIDDVNLTEVFENEDMLNYNVYRDGEILGNVEETMYTDMDLATGDYQYYVTALYDEGESDPSNVLDITVEQAAYLPFFEDFDNFTAGEQVACQDPVNWTTWSNLPCDPIEDAYISDDQAYSGSNSVVIDDDNDLIFAFPEAFTTGTYKSSFWMYIPEGKDAYWNVLQDFDGGSSTWGVEVFFDGGLGSISIDEKTFDYEFDTWMLMELYINLDEDGAQLFVDGESVHFWSWTNGGLTQFGAFDFYGMVGFYEDCEYYFDDMMIEEVEWSMPDLAAPSNLEGELAGNDVHLTWDLLSGDLSEIAYDDGTGEQSWWISGNPTSPDDMMALRLTMPEDGTLQEVAFFTRTGTTGAFNFADVMVCPDDGAGTPDLSNPYESFGEQVIENTVMEWLMFTLTTPMDMTSGEDFWIVAQWVGGNTDGPFIGGDNTTEPAEDRNYWSNVPGVWNLFTTSNFMMRGYYSPAGKSYAGGGISMIMHKNDKDLVVPVSSLTNPVLSDGTQSWKAPTIITGAKELTGYNVYRDGSVIGNTTEEMYDDMDLPVGQYEYYVTAVYDLGESDPSNTVMIDVITGIDQIGNEEVHIYPNPVTDLIYVETTAAIDRIILLNANGQVVVEEDVTDAGTITIDAADLSTGIYYLRIESENGWLNKKIIKK